MTTTTTTTTTAPAVPRGPIEAEISFIVPYPNTTTALYNYVEKPPEGQPPRNFDEVPFKVPIKDIRGKEHTYTLDHDAFQVLSNVPTATSYETYTSDEAVERVYYPEVKKLLLDNVPGSHKVVIFDHTIRRQDPAAPRKPVTRAHVDQTSAAAAERVRLHVPDKAEAEELLKGRYRIINVWRPINGTVVSAPLGVAEARSIAPGPDGDLVNIEHRYPHRTGEIMGVKYNQGQRWLYLSGVEGDERLLLKCADSAADEDGQGKVAARAPHSAFVDPSGQHFSDLNAAQAMLQRGICGILKPRIMAAAAGQKASDSSIVEPNLLHNINSHQLSTYAHQAAGPSFHIRILEAIKQDHRDITAFGELILKSTNLDEQTRCQNQFTWELARHAVAEELVLYPAMEKYLDRGTEMADKDRAEHQTVKEQLKVFQDLKPSDPRFIPTLQSLLNDLKKHIHEEETEDVPALDKALSQEESVGLSRSLDRTKMFVPSRSHPSAPAKPPFETAVGLMTAPLDHVSDMFRKWPGAVK